MDKAKYWRSLTSQEKQALADDLGITKDYLGHILKGYSQSSAVMAMSIDKATKHQVTKKALRPDIF